MISIITYLHDKKAIQYIYIIYYNKWWGAVGRRILGLKRERKRLGVELEKLWIGYKNTGWPSEEYRVRKQHPIIVMLEAESCCFRKPCTVVVVSDLLLFCNNEKWIVWTWLGSWFLQLLSKNYVQVLLPLDFSFSSIRKIICLGFVTIPNDFCFVSSKGSGMCEVVYSLHVLLVILGQNMNIRRVMEDSLSFYTFRLQLLNFDVYPYPLMRF